MPHTSVVETIRCRIDIRAIRAQPSIASRCTEAAKGVLMQPHTELAANAPYAVHRIPTALIETMHLNDGRSVLVRPVLPQDADLQQAFVRQLSPLSRRRRFHGPMVELPP